MRFDGYYIGGQEGKFYLDNVVGYVLGEITNLLRETRIIIETLDQRPSAKHAPGQAREDGSSTLGHNCRYDIVAHVFEHRYMLDFLGSIDRCDQGHGVMLAEVTQRF